MNVLKEFNIKTNNPELFEIAFVHSSYKVKYNLKKDYERLEFLGDSVLSLLVSHYLYENYEEFEEGGLTKLRSNFVCEDALEYYSFYLGFDKYLKMSNDNMTKNEIKSANADIVESFLGALFLDQGIEKTKEFLERYIFKFIDSRYVFFTDYKSKIKEYGDANEIEIKYEIVKETGYQHDKTFIMKILLDNKSFGLGKGKSKKEAEQSAAKLAVDKLGIDKNIFSVKKK
ncbi:MAG: ribonuclease III [Methanobrevibacter sp.]|jgi:ribonuclease-3|nr:ribonuclease III [Candidatus Methanovirga basalitermitum]